MPCQIRRGPRHFVPIIMGLTMGMWLTVAPDTAQALNFANLIRRISHVADDVPLNQADEVAQDLGRSRAARQILEETGTKLDDAAERGYVLRRLLRESIGESDTQLLRQLDGLDEPAQEAALVFARGANAVREGIPDLAVRARFLREGGGRNRGGSRPLR